LSSLIAVLAGVTAFEKLPLPHLVMHLVLRVKFQHGLPILISNGADMKSIQGLIVDFR